MGMMIEAYLVLGVLHFAITTCYILYAGSWKKDPDIADRLTYNAAFSLIYPVVWVVLLGEWLRE